MISDAERQRLHIGYKQSVRALSEKKAERLLIASDIDEKMSAVLKKAARESEVPVAEIGSMKELGEICGIDVGSSCAVVLK